MSISNDISGFVRVKVYHERILVTVLVFNQFWIFLCFGFMEFLLFSGRQLRQFNFATLSSGSSGNESHVFPVHLKFANFGYQILLSRLQTSRPHLGLG